MKQVIQSAAVVAAYPLENRAPTGVFARNNGPGAMKFSPPVNEAPVTRPSTLAILSAGAPCKAMNKADSGRHVTRTGTSMSGAIPPPAAPSASQNAGS